MPKRNKYGVVDGKYGPEDKGSEQANLPYSVMCISRFRSRRELYSIPDD